MIRFAENLNKMIDAGLGGALEAPRTEVAVGHRIQYMDASGPVASFETNVVAPLKKLLVNMRPVQAGSGDPSPENVRPITGRDSVTVTRTGKNLFDDSTLYHGSYAPATSALIAGEQYRTVIIDDLPAGTYTFSTDLANAVVLRRWSDGRNTYITAQTNSLSFTTTTNGLFMLCLRNADTTVITEDVHVQIELGSTATDYTAYNGQSATIALGQTVYGGTLDALTGTLMNEWSNIASYNGETLPGEWISDRDVYVPGTTPTIGAQVCYKLAEPQTIQLTPAELTTLVGDNTIWSDAGDVEVTYPYYEETEGY